MTDKLRVLQIEDDQAEAQNIVRVLTEQAYEVKAYCIHNAEEMQLALAHTWDVIICNHQLHDFDPYAALKILQKKQSDIPFIVVSSVDGDNFALSLMRAGAHDYVLKSHLDSLATVVAREVYEASNRRARQLADQLLKNSEKYYKAIVESTTDEVMRYDQSGRHLYGNSVALAALGVNLAQYVGKTDRDLGRPEHLCRLLENKLLSVFKTGESQVVEYDTVTTQGKQTFELRLFPEFSSDNTVVSVVGITRDMTEKMRSMALILQQANFDPLTGLPNRRNFCQYIEEQIKRSRRDGIPIALLLIDLDHFKQANDHVGRVMGDQLLVSVARRLSLCIREIDMLARLGGDEFAIFLTGIHNLQNVGRVTEMIMASLSSEFTIQHEKIHISACIGVAFCPDDASDLRELLQCADQALSLAKANGNAQCYYFKDKLVSSVGIAAENRQLQKALQEQQFKLYYQPVIDIKTGKMIAAEALLRWQHPERGLLGPDAFIPQAEKTGFIVELGNWIFKQACQQQLLWRQVFDAKFRISINLSQAQFRHGSNVLETWLEYLQMEALTLKLAQQTNQLSNPVKPQITEDFLTIEVPENFLLDSSSDMLETLQALNARGIQIGIDDFGSQYSALDYLRHLKVAYFKLDASFVRNLEASSKDLILCETLISMIHKLGPSAIAKGVEMNSALTLLNGAGCDYAQGYLFSKAVPVDQFEAMFASV